MAWRKRSAWAAADNCRACARPVHPTRARWQHAAAAHAPACLERDQRRGGQQEEAQGAAQRGAVQPAGQARPKGRRQHGGGRDQRRRAQLHAPCCAVSVCAADSGGQHRRQRGARHHPARCRGGVGRADRQRLGLAEGAACASGTVGGAAPRAAAVGGAWHPMPGRSLGAARVRAPPARRVPLGNGLAC